MQLGGRASSSVMSDRCRLSRGQANLQAHRSPVRLEREWHGSSRMLEWQASGVNCLFAGVVLHKLRSPCQVLKSDLICRTQRTADWKQQLRSLGIAGIVAYGLLNTVYYGSTFMFIWLYVVKAPRGVLQSRQTTPASRRMSR